MVGLNYELAYSELVESLKVSLGKNAPMKRDLLVYALAKNRYDLAEICFSTMSDVNFKDITQSILSFCADAKALLWLMERGASAEIDDCKYDFLSIAINTHNLSALELLINLPHFDPKVYTKRHRDVYRYSYFMCDEETQRNNLLLYDLLYAKGILPNNDDLAQISLRTYSPDIRYVEQSHEQTVSWLIDHGCSPNAFVYDVTLRYRDSLLAHHVALRADFLKKMSLSDPELADSTRNLEDPRIALLLRSGADPNLEVRSRTAAKYGGAKTALDIALAMDDTATIALLESHGGHASSPSERYQRLCSACSKEAR